jgi:uncharacterized DUF497 family protein
MGSFIAKIRRKASRGEYELTGHAKRELESEGYSFADVRAALQSGRIVSTQRHGAGPRKRVIAGRAVDGRELFLVCRLTSVGTVRIITAFGPRP